jgi:branched-subunit amino acid ABC-type transport system permease component
VAAAVDLHAHTNASDGSDDPQALVRTAAAAGVGVVAITDHDTVEALPSVIAAGVALGVVESSIASLDVGGLSLGPSYREAVPLALVLAALALRPLADAAYARE